MSSHEDCPHYTVIRVPSRREPPDPIAVARICLKCGAAFLLYPMNLKNHPKLQEKLKQFAKDATNNIPKL